VRLSEARAKLDGREVVAQEDAEEIVELHANSLPSNDEVRARVHVSAYTECAHACSSSTHSTSSRSRSSVLCEL
jgi:DNA replicative helicase MCM subunit Mcm2 (Cdc46/Mcm family)